MTFPRLLAKSSRTPDQPLFPETLEGHLTTVGAVALAVSRECGAQVIGSLNLDSATWQGPLIAATVRGALLHDIGKANDHFQHMIRKQSRLPQAIRHEVMSLWLLAVSEDLNRWLFAGMNSLVRYVTLRAVVGHHLQFNPANALEPRASGAAGMHLLTDHQDFSAALRSIGSMLGLASAIPALKGYRLSLSPEDFRPVRNLLWEGNTWWDGATLEERRFAAAVAALVIAADVCGSALVKQSQEPAKWATEALKLTCQGPDLARVATHRLAGADRRAFQEQVANSSTRLTLVSAGCGTGKTVAAYLWGANCLAGRKLFFCYPTTGTTTEGFLDYALPEFQEEAALVHSRALVDIERILENGGEEGQSSPLYHAWRYQGLQPWGARVTICTADAVLGLVQNNRVGLFGFPAIASGGFVFDEIHLYDNRLFGALLTFVECLQGAPVLLMTATLSPSRRTALLALARRLGEEITEVSGPLELEGLPRYTLSVAGRDGALEQALVVVSAGKRVLWVTNTVERAVAMAKEAEGYRIAVEPYHSRYRYGDRLQHHRTVVDRFKEKAISEGTLAVTTQVCEVSLDISADLLVTEVAPIPALIQRLGRLNRWATPESFQGPLPALVIDPEGYRPYQEVELVLAKHWVQEMRGGPRSQAELHQAFGAVLEAEPLLRRGHSAWLDEAWIVEPAPLREPGATLNVPREEDLGHCLDWRGRPVATEVIRYSVPMPFHPVAGQASRWRRIGGVPVAPHGSMEYSERWGARWR
jgi:CRISPR-associated endonuclease/helicase Cas3